MLKANDERGNVSNKKERGPYKVNYLSSLKALARYSFFSLEIFVIEISFGQTASQACVKVQLPNPSLSICSTIESTLVFLSGAPCGNKAK
jgi:hypothetical protein